MTTFFYRIILFYRCRYVGFSNDVRLHELTAAQEGWKDAPMISEKAAIEARRMPGVTVLTRCNCKGFCNAKSCSCFNKGRSCTYRSHRGGNVCKCLNTGNTVQPTTAAPSMLAGVVAAVASPTSADACLQEQHYGNSVQPTTIGSSMSDGNVAAAPPPIVGKSRRVSRMPARFCKN